MTSEQLDVEGLSITVTSAPATAPGEKAPKTKGKGKASSEGTEILTNAKLRLKAGSRYALVGRNGSGKSSKLSTTGSKLLGACNG